MECYWVLSSTPGQAPSPEAGAQHKNGPHVLSHFGAGHFLLCIIILIFFLEEGRREEKRKEEKHKEGMDLGEADGGENMIKIECIKNKASYFKK